MGTLLGHANINNNNDEKLKVEQQIERRHNNKNSMTLDDDDENNSSSALSKNLKTLDYTNSDVVLNKVMDNIKIKLGNMAAEKSNNNNGGGGGGGSISSASYLYTSVKYVLMPIILMFISVASPNCTVSLKAIITCFVILHIFIVLQPHTIFDEIIK